MISCIFISVSASLLCGLLGFFIGKRFTGNNHDTCNDRIKRLESSLEQSKQAKFKVDKELKTLKQLI